MKKISDSTIRRLSKYYRSLEFLIDKGTDTVSSDQLAEMDGITSAQVRKDLSFFGTFGKRGLGYNCNILKNQIGEILGLNREWNVAIVGAGNVGRALADYAEFKKQGFKINLILDSDPQKIGSQIHGITVQDIRKVKEWVKSKKVDIAIIAVPVSAAQQAADLLVDSGVRAILNFAPISLKVSGKVQVKNENMAIEIESLSYYLTSKRN
jgi:redox-sensing transcriptional repressor